MAARIAVATFVINGTADVGVAVLSDAAPIGLDFAPIGFEEYDFAIPEKYADTKMMQAFFKVLKSTEFQKSFEGAWRI